MIRAAALLCLMALPASAQDFRGLLPGMPASDLARLGEPFELETEGAFTFASYPLPFDRYLDVIHGHGEIVTISLSALANTGLRPPSSGPLTVGETLLADAVDLAGSDGFAFEVIQALPTLPPSGWALSYTLAEHPDLVLNLVFYGRADPDIEIADISGVQDMPQDAVLVTASLRSPSIIARHPFLSDLQQVVPADTTAFALSFADAFPLIEIPR